MRKPDGQEFSFQLGGDSTREDNPRAFSVGFPCSRVYCMLLDRSDHKHLVNPMSMRRALGACFPEQQSFDVSLEEEHAASCFLNRGLRGLRIHVYVIQLIFWETFRDPAM